MQITFTRNGKRRSWTDDRGRPHTEEVVDVSLDGVKLARGVCCRYFKRIVRLGHGQSASFELTKVGEEGCGTTAP